MNGKEVMCAGNARTGTDRRRNCEEMNCCGDDSPRHERRGHGSEKPGNWTDEKSIGIAVIGRVSERISAEARWKGMEQIRQAPAWLREEMLRK
jgi:hypothetical protein